MQALAGTCKQLQELSLHDLWPLCRAWGRGGDPNIANGKKLYLCNFYPRLQVFYHKLKIIKFNVNLDNSIATGYNV